MQDRDKGEKIECAMLYCVEFKHKTKKEAECVTPLCEEFIQEKERERERLCHYSVGLCKAKVCEFISRVPDQNGVS